MTSHLEDLQNIVAFKANTIETYFSGLNTNIKIAQGLYNIKKNLPVLTRFARETTNPEFIAAKKMLDGQLQGMQEVLHLPDIMLADPEGKVVYSVNPGHYLKELLNILPDPGQKSFEKGKTGIYVTDIFLNKENNNKSEILV
ncbi:MAG: hypothetical protein PHN57_07770, partial [Candidatus Omnitrophica bacterium]|nr:hypothetical protein [Candidatus Omnitrophota bacterium]